MTAARAHQIAVDLIFPLVHFHVIGAEGFSLHDPAGVEAVEHVGDMGLEQGLVAAAGGGKAVCRCRFAVLNPELTYTLPWYQTASGCVDIMMHIMERYFTPDTDTMLTDGMSEQIIRTVMHHARILKTDPENYNFFSCCRCARSCC